MLSPLGAGGMGEVYRARDTRLKRDVAIKVLPESVARDPERTARFQREAEVLASLSQPNIAAVHGIEESGGITALILELVEGPTLAERIALAPLDVAETVGIAKQIADALEAAHAAGIVHRDLKPANIKIRPDGTVKVLDFGLAKAFETSAGRNTDLSVSPTITSPAMSAAGVILGTASYMAPEQARGRPVDKRADIWAFGCVVYEMLTGCRAFGGDEVPDTLAAVLAKEVDWSRLPSTLPASLRRLLKRCIEKDRQKRLADISDARLDLADALASEDGISSSPPAPVPSGVRGWMILAAAAVGLALGGGAIWSMRPPAPVAESPRAFRTSIIPAPGTIPVGNMSLAISPNGQYLAFSGRDASGANRVWLRPLDSNEVHLLPEADGGGSLFWSPDSRELAFNVQGRIMRMSTSGGPPTLICDVPGGGSGGLWLPDGRVVIGGGGLSNNVGLRACKTDGSGAVEEVSHLDKAAGESSHGYPAALPDGRHVVFTAYRASESLGIYLTTLGSSEHKLLVQDGANAGFSQGFLLFTRGTTLLAQKLDPVTFATEGAPRPIAQNITTGGGSGQTGAFAVSAGGILVYSSGRSQMSQLEWLDRTGRRLSLVGEAGLYRNPRLSPDDTKIVVERLSGSGGVATADLWILDARRGVPQKLTSAAGGELSPVWSHDSRSVTYAINKPAIVRQRVEATEAEAEIIFTADAQLSPQDYSLHDDVLLFDKNVLNGRRPTAFLVTLADRSSTEFLKGASENFQSRVSPDGTLLAFASTESGRPEVYVADFPKPSGKKRVSITGGIQPVWRRDGKELFFLSPEGGLMAASIERKGGLVAGEPVQLFVTRTEGGPLVLHQYDVAQDGRFLVNSSIGESSLSPLTLVVNWTQLLQER